MNRICKEVMKKTFLFAVLPFMAVLFAAILYLFLHMKPHDQLPEAEKSEKKLAFSWMGDNVFGADVQEGLTSYEKRHPGISFSLSYGSDNGYWDQLYMAAANHELPDLMVLDYGHIGVFAEKKQLFPMDSYIESGRISVEGIAPMLLACGQFGGRQVGIPIGIKAPALLYNEAITTQAGITLRDGMTLSEFALDCRRVYNQTRYKTLLPEEQSLNLLSYILRGEGKSVFGENGPGYEDPMDTLPFFELYETASREGWAFDRNAFGQTESDSIAESPLTSGNGPSNMSWCGFYHSNDLVTGQKGAKTGVELAITTWPSDHFDRSIFYVPSGFFTIAAYTDWGQECANVINAFSHEQIHLDKIMGGMGLAADKSYRRWQKGSVDPIRTKEMEYLENIVLPKAGEIPKPYRAEHERLNALLIRLENEILVGSITASEAAERFYQEAWERSK